MRWYKIQKEKTDSLVGSHWVRANSWVICVLVLMLLVEDSNNHPTEGGADTTACPGKSLQMPPLRWRVLMLSLVAS